MTRKGRRDYTSERSGIEEAAGNGATGCSVKAPEFGDVGTAEKRKPFDRSICENGSKKSFLQKMVGLLRGAS